MANTRRRWTGEVQETGGETRRMLHLIPHAVDVAQRAVRLPGNQVAGAEHQGVLRLVGVRVEQRVGHKVLSRELREADVAAREAGAADMQLPGHADRHRVLQVVQHQCLRTASRNGPHGLPRQQPYMPYCSPTR